MHISFTKSFHNNLRLSASLTYLETQEAAEAQKPLKLYESQDFFWKWRDVFSQGPVTFALVAR